MLPLRMRQLRKRRKITRAFLRHAPKHAFSTGQCTYCGHCAPCPVRIDIAMVNKLYDLALMHEEIPGTVRAHYEQLNANASDCIGCKGCESGLSVPCTDRRTHGKSKRTVRHEVKDPAASYGASNLQHSRAAGYLTLAAVAKWTCKHVRLARCPRE